MKKNVELFVLAYKNLKGQKKHRKIFILILIAPLLCCMLGNSLVKSFDNSLRNMCNRGLGRLELINEVEDKPFEQIRDAMEAVDGVGEVSRVTLPITGVLENRKNEFGSEHIQIAIRSSYKGLSDYAVSGKTENLEYGEIIIPEYLYGMGSFGNYEYTSGTKLIGEEFLIMIDTEIELSFRVAGTFDNIKTGDSGSEFFIHPEEADEINSKVTKKYIQEYLKENPEEETWIPTKQIGVYIKEGYDIQEVCDRLYYATGYRPLMACKVADETMLMFYAFIIKIVNIFVVMLTVVCFVSIIMIISAELRKRLGESAVYLALGYQKKDMLKVFFYEKIFMCGKAILYSSFFTLSVLLGANYILQNFMEFYKRYIVFQPDIQNFVTGFIIMTGAVVTGILMIAVRLKKVNIVEIVRRE